MMAAKTLAELMSASLAELPRNPVGGVARAGAGPGAALRMADRALSATDAAGIAAALLCERPAGGGGGGRSDRRCPLVAPAEAAPPRPAARDRRGPLIGPRSRRRRSGSSGSS
jgi:hypothetical protein